MTPLQQLRSKLSQEGIPVQCLEGCSTELFIKFGPQVTPEQRRLAFELAGTTDWTWCDADRRRD